jgi:hypothetical protein
MLQYLYTTDYDEEKRKNTLPPLLLNLLVTTVADKYDVPALVALARVKFSQRATSDWRSGAFAEAVEDIYDNPTDAKQGLRDTVVRICVDNATELFAKSEDGQVSLQLRELANSVPCFAAEMASRMAEKLQQRAELLAQERAKENEKSENDGMGFGLFD